ncbi:uncharacterized protein [Amphiura filiformis]|uniref:uncharacterized protein n=1 Tax=Amphiura filiformis TaxID=82378 RepID=UPI003B20F559
MDANGTNTIQASRLIGWKNNNNHSRNSRRKRRTLGKVHTQRVASTESITLSEKRRKDRVHLSLEELRSLLPTTGSSGETNKDPVTTQEELLAMAVEYLRARRANVGSLSSSSSLSSASSSSSSGSNVFIGTSYDSKYTDHTAAATPQSKRSRRRQQHYQNNDHATETAATPRHNVAFHPSSPTNAMLEGFRECMEETIRYLVEVEHLPPDHDIVVRLRAHLLKAQSKLDLNNRVRGGSLVDPSCTARAIKTHGSQGTQVGSAASTQTSPDAVSYSSPAQIPVWVPSGQNGHPASRGTAPISRTSGLPNSSTARKVMKPLTVDTNQYYAMPSPLMSHCTSNSSSGNSNESLLTIARTLPTTTQPTYSTANVTGRTLSYRRPAPVQGAYLHRQHNTTVPTMVYSTTTLTAPITATALPTTVTSATGHHLGFNLNYVAPYIMAWVRPAQQ